MNFFKMLAVFLISKSFCLQLSGKHMCIKINNVTAVADIGKMDTSHSRKWNTLTRQIWGWCIQNAIFITMTHAPGKENLVADAESRKSRKETEWSRYNKIFKTGI